MRTTKLMTRSEALVEAQRCLGCFDPPCQQACPARVNIPGFIRRLSEDNLEGAGELLYQACPLASTCGMACPTTVLCEGACTLLKQGQTAVRIGSLQTHVAMNYALPEHTTSNPQAGKVAVIGAGPSGLGCAIQLRRMGHSVDVYDRQVIPGGLVDRVIPAHRLPHAVVQFDMDRFGEAGIGFHLGEEIEAVKAQQLLADYAAVFIGTGLSSLKAFSVPGDDAAGVQPALDYLDAVRSHALGLGPKPDLGSCVVVVGGGNVALDAAVVAKKLGAGRVIALYRRTKDEMPGWESEYLEAASLGVEFRWLSVVGKIINQGGRIAAVEVHSMRLTEAKAGGRRWVEPDPASPPYVLPCTALVHALGQALDPSIAGYFGLGLTPEETLAVSPGTCRAGDTKVFAAGEAVTGGTTVVASMSQGMAAGRAIHDWLERNGG